MSIFHIRKTGSLNIVALITVLILGWILRAQVTLVPDLITGVNGAYYLVQTRAILNTGFLGIPDFPLLFYLQALLSAVISLFTSTDLAVFTAVRLTDTVLPVLLAVPVCLFARQFALNDNQRYISAAATLTVGLIAVGNESIIRMAGDFQKNAAALPLFLAFVYFFYMSLEYHHRRDIVLSLIFLCLICFTHIGVAALAITTTGLIIIISIILNKDFKRALVIVSALVISLFVSLYLVSLFDHDRVIRLVRFAVNPGKLFSGSLVSTWLGLSFRPNSPQVFEGVILGNVLGVIGILTVVLYRKNMDHAARAVLWASSLNALLYASPFIGGELSQRLGMMAFVPGLIPFTFFVTRTKWNCLVSFFAAVIILLSTIRILPYHFQQTLTLPAYTELQSFKNSLPHNKSIVVARHGLEWWAAWTMETRVANNLETVLGDWDKYDAVFMLEQINPQAFRGGDFHPGQVRPPRGIPLIHHPPRQDIQNPMNPFPEIPGGQGFRGPGVNMFSPEIRVNLRKGTYFRLSQIIQKPDMKRPPVFPGDDMFIPPDFFLNGRF